MQAQVIGKKGDTPCLRKENTNVPKFGRNEVLVKVTHSALNPTDVQSLDKDFFEQGSILGCDFVGTVADIGQDVRKYNKGDKIAGLVWGGERPGRGAYAEYTVADEAISFKVPDGIDDARAVTVPLALTTAWLALFSKQCLDIPMKHDPAVKVLIWGASSSVGSYAIQIASHFGFEVVTTCSPKHNDRAKQLGARHVFDYNSATVLDDIAAAVPKIAYVFDTIGSSTSSPASAKSLGVERGHFCTVRPDKSFTDEINSSVNVSAVLVWTAFLKDHAFGPLRWPADAADHELAAKLYDHIPRYLVERVIQPSDPIILDRGLDSIEDGFEMQRQGKISAQKIVFANY